MKTMRNALNITADNHELVKAGYIQLPVPNHDHGRMAQFTVASI